MAEQSTYASVNETARQHFEAAWRDGKTVRIEEHLPHADDPRYLATLEELVHIDLEMSGWPISGHRLSQQSGGHLGRELR
ncbi:MAG: hypothetical protein FJ303_12140 [Planctomycetes bacterium]|nr:hypothetical protein [Planctomycetota bacterium]